MDIPDIYNLDNFNTQPSNVLHIHINEVGNIVFYHNDIIIETQSYDMNGNIFDIKKYSGDSKYFYMIHNEDYDFGIGPNKPYTPYLNIKYLYETKYYDNMLITNDEQCSLDIYFYFYENNIISNNIRMGDVIYSLMRKNTDLYINIPTDPYPHIKYIYILSNSDERYYSSAYFKNQKFIKMISINSLDINGEIYFYMYKVNDDIILYLHKIIYNEEPLIFCIKQGNDIIHNYGKYLENYRKLASNRKLQRIHIEVPYNDKFDYFYSFEFSEE